VTKSDVMTFTLVPQTDRRQQPDRRKSWRGSRRAADLLLREQSLLDGERAAEWNTVGSHARGSGEESYPSQSQQPARKLYVH
jgi:hypothetical protein